MFIKVKVFPDSKKEEIVKNKKGSFEIKVKQKPIQGLANLATIKILSLYFEIPERKIRLIKGFKQRNKIFKIID